MHQASSALKTLGWHYPWHNPRPIILEKSVSLRQERVLNQRNRGVERTVRFTMEDQLESVQTIGPSVNPHERLKDAVMTGMVPMALLKQMYILPFATEMVLGDLAVLPLDAFNSTQWKIARKDGCE